MSTLHSPHSTIDRAWLKKFTTASNKSPVPCFRVLLLGTKGAGKTALAVRFLTKRFIGEYDSSVERMYQLTDAPQGSPVQFMVLDTVNHDHQKSDVDLKDQINWADAFIVLYSVTDEASFREVDRLKFLINHLKKSKSTERLFFPDQHTSPPAPISTVFLVGNKIDIYGERTVTHEAGELRCRTSDFAAFHEISVRESVNQSLRVFHDLYATHWTEHSKRQKSGDAKVGRSISAAGSPSILLRSLHFKRQSLGEKSRSPSPCRSSRPGSASPCKFRIQVSQHTLDRHTGETVPEKGSSNRRLGDDLWQWRFDEASADGDDDFEEAVSIRVPKFSF